MLVQRVQCVRAAALRSATTAASSARVSSPLALQSQQKATLHDITVKNKTGLPIQRAGPFGGGR